MKIASNEVLENIRVVQCCIVSANINKNLKFKIKEGIKIGNYTQTYNAWVKIGGKYEKKTKRNN